MRSGLSRTVGRFRQPEYTGENRCIPCTTVNVVIAAALSAGAAVLNPLLGVAVLAVSSLSIYFRGYLIPGTPTLTKRYFPDWLLAVFEKEPPTTAGGAAVDPGFETDDSESDAPEPEVVDDGAGDGATDDGLEVADPETVLLEHSIVEPCEDVDDLCLTDDVRERWRDRIATLRDGDRGAQVAAFLEREPDEIEVETGPDGDAVGVRVDGRVGARWESDAALLADLAGTDVLADRIPGWDRLEIDDRSQLTSGLRAFVEACPACEGAVSIDEETVESCCRSHQVYAVTCEDCEARILEVQG